MQPSAQQHISHRPEVCAHHALHADIHSPALTIRESLVFSAECRLIIDDQNQLQEFVDEVSSHAPCLPA